MDDIQRAIADAWNRLRPILDHDPAQLRRRLSRRHAALINRPPRAWCLAVRATDTRLERYCINYPDDSEPHQLALDSRALRRLCAPVHLTAPGQPLREVAALLGVSPRGLLDARLNGLFQTRYIPRLGGKPGKPTPLLYTPEPLDPCARGFVSNDALWSTTARHAAGRIPSGIEQTLTRVPLHQGIGPAYRQDAADLHPEHPDVDPPIGKPRNYTLPPPPSDYVAYKWKDGHYLGYDWRSPGARAQHERHERELELSRAAKKQRRLDHPPPGKSNGSLQFRGWRWLCPKCGRRVNVLFYPLPRLAFLPKRLFARKRMKDEGGRMKSDQIAGFDSSFILPTSSLPSPSFACEKCHRLKRLGRTDPNAWNELITYLTAGLLYGREVERPAWFPRISRASIQNPNSKIPNRKIPYTPRPTREPSKRRAQIEPRLLARQPFKSIAADLGLAKGTVLWYAQQIYKQHDVRTLNALLIKHGETPKLSKKEQVRRRIARGESLQQIAREIGISAMCVYNHVYMLRKAGRLRPIHNEVDNLLCRADNLSSDANC